MGLLDSNRETEFEYIHVKKNWSKRIADFSHYNSAETKKKVTEILHKNFEYFGYDK